jgi:hypothetical protein
LVHLTLIIGFSWNIDLGAKFKLIGYD